MRWMKQGAMYFSTSSIAWPKNAPAMCRYIIQKAPNGHWLLWQWNEAAGTYAQARAADGGGVFLRLYYAQERADWLERKDLRTGVKADLSPVDAAQAVFESQLAREGGNP